jgi:hypothetical protein
MEDDMNRQNMLLAAVLGLATVSAMPALYAQDNRADAVLAEAMEDTTVTLQQGLTAAGSVGRPISAKFELEDGKLQLSIYTAKGGKFSENIIDLSTGKVGKTEPIAGGDDLADAKAQNAAMGKSKAALKTIADNAVKANAGYVALSLTPALKGGRGVVSVVLLKGNQLKTIEQPLK